MDKIKVSMGAVPETMLQTMYARARESQKPNAVIHDEKAVEIIQKLDYDFTLADKDAPMSSGVIARTIILDRLVSKYFDKHQNAVVINIACGLDTRCYRNEGRYARWYNIDLPDTINVRKQFLQEEGPVIYQIAESAMDSSWAERINYHGEPVLVIIEGLTMYLSESDVKKIFEIIDNKFTHAYVLVETMNPFMAAHIKEKSIDKSNAKFNWGIKNGKELEKLIPPFKYVRDYSLAGGMAEFVSAYKVLSKIPAISNISNKITILKK
ncbi:MAG: class I SAM-dependent methyltransferase [Oscillospiraceae bacterium]|nr:class I SAM-dependent methyltransferase [Oscillospiraceae bacterium]